MELTPLTTMVVAAPPQDETGARVDCTVSPSPAKGAGEFERLRRSFTVMSILCAALALGCASSPPAHFYALSPLQAAPEPSAQQTPTRTIGLGPVTWPEFLDQPQLVSRPSANRLSIDEFSRWGGSLQEEFMRVWSENLSLLLGDVQILALPSEIRRPLDARVTVNVLAFEPIGDDAVVLKARWAIMDETLERTALVRISRYQQQLESTADEAVRIAAMSALLAQFSREVAQAVRTTPLFSAPD